MLNNLSKSWLSIFLILLVNSLQAQKDSSPQRPSGEQVIRVPSSRPTIKLSPNVRSVEKEIQQSVIPMEIIQQFLMRPKIVAEEEMESAGYVMGNPDQTLLTAPGQTIYVRRLDRRPKENQFLIVALGRVFRDPTDKDKVLAYEAIYLGEAVLTEAAGHPTLDDEEELTLLKVTSAVREIEEGARVIPWEGEAFNEDFRPDSPRHLEEAYIIGVVDDAIQVAQYQVVVINQGVEDGLKRGHLLAVEKVGQLVKDKTGKEMVKLPPQRAATILVFKVFENVSYALVTQSTLPINLLDKVVVP